MFINSITAALQSTASVSKADFSQKKNGREKHVEKERSREGRKSTNQTVVLLLPTYLSAVWVKLSIFAVQDLGHQGARIAQHS